MKGKVLKIVLVMALITTMLLTDFLLVGYNIVQAVSTTNVENVDFDAYLKEGDINTYQKQVNVQQGDILVLSMAVKDGGVLKEGKIKIENANFKIKEVENQYIKSIDTATNEIELNQLIAGSQVEVEIPIVFEKTAEMTKDYLLQEAKVQLTGVYKNAENDDKVIEAERNISIQWEENEEVTIDQTIEKWLAVEEKHTLIEQGICVKIINNTLVQENRLEVAVPEIQNVLPETVDVLINGNKAPENSFTYDKETKTVTITHQKTNTQAQDSYKVLYHYPENIQAESIPLHTSLKTNLYTEETIETEDSREVETQQTNHSISVESQVTESMYKGYLYANLDKETAYEETMDIEVADLTNLDEIKIGNMQDHFLDATGSSYTTNSSTYIKTIKLKKENVMSVLGSSFSITIQDTAGQVIAQITPSSNWNEAGELEVALEGKDISQLEMVCNKPIQIGTLHVGMNRCIKGVTGYTREQLKTMVALENTKVVRAGADEITATSKSELKDTTTTAKLQLSNTNLTTVHTNENIQMTAILKADSNAYDLYKNPYIEIKFPEELQNIDVHAINPVYANEFTFVKSGYIPERKTIVLQLQGEQADYRTILEEGIQIAINADLTFAKNTPNKTVTITMNYQNEFGNEPQYETHVDCNLSSKYGAILYNHISGYNQEGTTIETIEEETVKAELDLQAPQKQAVMNQSFINNYDASLNQVTMMGSLQGENTSIENITSNQENVNIYYSEKENAPMQDASWTQSSVNAKSYKIEVMGELSTADAINIAYQVKIPENVTPGSEILQQTHVNYLYNGQPLSTSSSVLFAAQNVEAQPTGNQATEPSLSEPESTPPTSTISILPSEIQTKVEVTSGRKTLTGGDEIYEGQPVRYTVSVTNKSQTDLHNFQLTAEHSNVEFYVAKEDNEDLIEEAENPHMTFTERDPEATNITRNAQTIKQGETVTFVYEFAPKKKEGTEITGKIMLQADELQQVEKTMQTNYIKDSEIALEVLNATDENYQLFEKDTVFYTFNVISNSNKEYENIKLTMTLGGNVKISDKCKAVTTNIGATDAPMIPADQDVLSIESIDSKQVVLNIKKLRVGETLRIMWWGKTGASNTEADDAEYSQVTAYCEAELNGKTYCSNQQERSLARATAKVTATQTAEVHRNNKYESGSYVDTGDTITYVAQITNKDTVLSTTADLFHNVTTVNGKITNAYVRKNNGQIINANIYATQSSTAKFDLQPGETAEYVADVEVWENPTPGLSLQEQLTSSMELIWTHAGALQINPVSFYVASSADEDYSDGDIENMDPTLPNDPGNTPGDDSGENQGGTQTPSDGNQDGNQNGTQTGTNKKGGISGKAWVDQNQDGIKDAQEKGLENIRVNLVNPTSQAIMKSTNTDANGDYQFANIEEGNYIVMFLYDTNTYTVTQYHKDGVLDSLNSDVIQKVINNVTVAATDGITVTDTEMKNIDAGFIETKIFDLKLNKSILKVTVDNAEGVKEVRYDKTKLAKVDIHAKQLANSTVTVQYLIEIINEGETPGYATDIIDYKPNDLTFDAAQNEGWYMGQDQNLHNSSLEKTIIQPGETKQLTLTLIKKMTTSNTGTSTNIAEIAGATNEKSSPDTDSTPGNRKDGEDDISTAELIVSIKTGAIVYITVGIITAIFVLTLVGIVLMKKKKGGQEYEMEIH